MSVHSVGPPATAKAEESSSGPGDSHRTPLRIVSWNVNGLRALQRSLCLQLCRPCGGCGEALKRHEARVGESVASRDQKEPLINADISAAPWAPHALRVGNTHTKNARPRPAQCAALRILFEAHFSADVVCLQESKAPSSFSEIEDHLVDIGDGWESFWSICSVKPGYSGCTTFARKGLVRDQTVNGISTTRGSLTLDPKVFDDKNEGRCVVTNIAGALVLFNLYVPNGGRGDEHVDFKMRFCREVQRQCAEIRRDSTPATPHVAILGDLNTCHRPIDIHNPEAHVANPPSGFMPIERAWLDEIFGEDPKSAVFQSGDAAPPFVDTFRFCHGDKPRKFSWFSVRTQQRDLNNGWRLDYIGADRDMVRGETPLEPGSGWVRDAGIDPAVLGSDHVPVWVDLAIPADKMKPDRSQVSALSNHARRRVKQASIAGFFSRAAPKSDAGAAKREAEGNLAREGGDASKRPKH